MSQLSITTTQNVNINFNAANPGERVLAYLIDVVIFFAYYLVMFSVIFSVTGLEKYLSGRDNWTQIAVYGLAWLPMLVLCAAV